PGRRLAGGGPPRAHGSADSRRRAVGPLDRFQNDLRAWDGNVLLSSEGISNWVVPWLFPALRRLLEAAREVEPVTTLWTMRRMDDLFTSMYLHQVLLGRMTPATEWFEHRFKYAWIEGFMAGNATVETLDGVGSAYVKDWPDGAHWRELLHALSAARR